LALKIPLKRKTKFDIGDENYNESICSSLVGTEEYIAPEVLKSQEVSYSTDLWSLGIILYQFLLGSTPFKGSS